MRSGKGRTRAPPGRFRRGGRRGPPPLLGVDLRGGGEGVGRGEGRWGAVRHGPGRGEGRAAAARPVGSPWPGFGMKKGGGTGDRLLWRFWPLSFVDFSLTAILWAIFGGQLRLIPKNGIPKPGSFGELSLVHPYQN